MTFFEKKITYFNSFFDQFSTRNYLTNVYGFARSALAFGTLSTLLAHPLFAICPKTEFGLNRHEFYLDKFNLYFLCGYENLWIGQLISIAILILVIVGYFPQITGVLHWWVSFSFFSSVTLVDGGDQITTNLTLFLIPLTLLDRRINHWYEPKLTSYRQNFIAKIIFFILLIQVAVIYLQAGVEKLYLCKEFVDGTAVYYWFNHNIFGLPEWLRPAVNSLLKYPIIMAFTTWGTVIFEIVMFGIVFSSPPVRRKFLWAAIIFHLSILFFFGLFSFFFAMMGCIILYCLPWDEQIDFKKIFRR